VIDKCHPYIFTWQRDRHDHTKGWLKGQVIRKLLIGSLNASNVTWPNVIAVKPFFREFVNLASFQAWKQHGTTHVGTSDQVRRAYRRNRRDKYEKRLLR
jgi:hypothetical protein